MVERAPDRLAVDGYHFAREPGLEGVGVDQREHAPEGVVRGDAVRKLQEGAEPSQLAATVERDVLPALGTGDHRAYGNHQDVAQAMLNLAVATRIFNRAEILP